MKKELINKIKHHKECIEQIFNTIPIDKELGQYHLGSLDTAKDILFKLVGHDEYHKILVEIGEE